MINNTTYYKRGYEYLETNEKEIMEYFLNSLQNDELSQSTKTLIELFDILNGKHKFFISRETPNVFKLISKKEEIQKKFINFFFDTHIDEIIELYKKFKADNFALSYYLALITKFILKGKPKESHILKLYLFHINNLITYKDEKDSNLKTTLKTISLKSLKKFACNEKILQNIIDEKDLKEYSNLNLEPYIEYKIFLHNNQTPFLNIFIKKELIMKQTYIDKEKLKEKISTIIKNFELKIDKETLFHNIDEIISNI